MFERYDERARRTVFFARWWALNRKAPKIGTCDLILGAAQESRREDSPLCWMNLDFQRVVALFADGVVCVQKPEDKDLALSDASKRALAYTAEEAKRDGRYSIDAYHLVRGVLRTNDATAKTMVEAGWNLDSLRTASREANRNIPDVRARQTNFQMLRWRLLRIPRYVVWGIAFLGFLAAILYLRSQN